MWVQPAELKNGRKDARNLSGCEKSTVGKKIEFSRLNPDFKQKLGSAG